MSKRQLVGFALCALLVSAGGIVPHPADAGGFGGCMFDFQCDDFNFCTSNFCVNRNCFFPPINCDDNNQCTTDSCSGFAGCANIAIACNDGNDCTLNTCDPNAGCAFPEGGCDDGDACTDDLCVAGSTCGNTPVDCDDGDACTADACDTISGCSHTPITVGPCAGTPVAGTRLRVDDVGPPRGKRNAVTLSGAAIDLTGLDPTVTGATVIIGQPGGPSTAIDLPASGWTKRGNRSAADYKYKSDGGGAVLAARVRDGRSIRLSARGDGVYGLGGTPQGSLGVVVEIGSGRFCSTFGGAINVDDGSHFFAVRAPAPASCPDLGQ